MKAQFRLTEKVHYIMRKIWKQLKLQMSERNMKGRAARCCGILHVKTLAIAIAISEMIFLIYQAVMAFTYIFSPSSHDSLSATVYVIAVMMAWVTIILLLIGIFCQIPILLVPHMLMQVLFVLTLLAMSSFALYALLVGTSLQLRMTLVGMQVDITSTVLIAPPSIKVTLISGFLTGLLILIAIGYFIVAMMNVWSFHVVMDCYRWLGHLLEEKARALGHSSLVVGPTVLDTKTVAVIHATDF